MKKFFLATLLVIGSFSLVLSQESSMWIGGGLRFSTVDTDGAGQTIFGFSPEFGYRINESFAVGGNVGFNSVINKNATGNKQTTNVFSIAPFARYTFASFNRFQVFGQGELPLNFYSGKNFDGSSMDSYNSVGISLRPGLYYSINEKWGFNMLMPSVLSFVTYSNNYTYFGFSVNNGYTIQNYIFDTTIGFVYNF